MFRRQLFNLSLQYHSRIVLERPVSRVVLANVSPCVSAPSQSRRSFATPSQSDKIAEFEALFSEARDDIEYAQENSGTVYFAEEVETAIQSVNKVLALFSELSIPDKDRRFGLKVEELKASIEKLEEELHNE